MIPGFTLFVSTAPFLAVFLLAAMIWVFRYRKEPAVASLIWFLFFIFWLLITNTAEMLAPSNEAIVFYSKLQYISWLYLPVTWLSFALRYTGWLAHTRRRLILSAVLIPAFAYIAVLTNEYHHLLWTRLTFFTSGPYSVLRPEHGPIYWMICIYSWVMNGAGIIILLFSFLPGQKVYWKQSIWMVMGSILPALTNIIYLSRAIPGFQNDFSPIAYGFTGIFFLAGMYFHRLFLVMPVARGALIQELNIGVLLMDRRGRIADFNTELIRLYAGAEIVASSRCSDYPVLAPLLEAAEYKPGILVDGTKSGRIQTDGRELRWTLRSMSAFSRTTFITLEDVTEHTRLQSDMNRIKEEFIKREKLATIGRIAAGLAHEINNPLAYLQSDTRSLQTLILRKYGEKAEQEAEITEILAIGKSLGLGLDRIEKAVGSLLSFARQGTLTAEFEKFDLQTVIDTTLDFIHHETRNRIRVVRELSPTLQVFGSRSEISQVLFNIMLNAVHAIDETPPPGGGEIRIDSGLTDSKPARVFCRISNNGPDIPEESRGRLFDLFFTTKDEKWGTGLGLSLSRDIIEQRHGGLLYLSSANPVSFMIELPVHDFPVF